MKKSITNEFYDILSADSIIKYAKKLKNNTLRSICSEEIEFHGYKGKGNFGIIIEKYYFKYEPNSNTEPDFKEAGLELKSSPIKILKNNEYRSKERLVLNIINYCNVYKEEFYSSSFYKKNAHLLLIFYLYEFNINLLDYEIKIVDDWIYSKEDLLIIKRDWDIINEKIIKGKAHEISEGDTFYLGACTKGSTAKKSLRTQPFSNLKAKQRAYALKQGYVNHIIAKLTTNEKEVYGKIIKSTDVLKKIQSIENFIISKFEPFYGKTVIEIENKFNLNLNRNAKNYYANITKAILGIELDKRIEEFEKADVITKTIRLGNNDLPKESVSFPTFKFKDIIRTKWENSDFYNILESKFFFVFYKYDSENLILKKVKFWNMSNSDISESKEVWINMIKLLKKGMIVKSLKNNRRSTFFPKKSDNRICHVRPHAKDKNDTYELPIVDKLTGVKEFTKQCFWFNDAYIRDEIYLKD